MRELEAQELCCFAYVMTIHQEVFALFNHENVDVANRRTAGRFVNDVAQVAGRISQLLCTVPDGGNAEIHLPAIQIVLPEKAVEAFENVRGAFVFL